MPGANRIAGPGNSGVPVTGAPVPIWRDGARLPGRVLMIDANLMSYSSGDPVGPLTPSVGPVLDSASRPTYRIDLLGSGPAVEFAFPQFLAAADALIDVSGPVCFARIGQQTNIGGALCLLALGWGVGAGGIAMTTNVGGTGKIEIYVPGPNVVLVSSAPVTTDKECWVVCYDPDESPKFRLWVNDVEQTFTAGDPDTAAAAAVSPSGWGATGVGGFAETGLEGLFVVCSGVPAWTSEQRTAIYQGGLDVWGT